MPCWHVRWYILPQFFAVGLVVLLLMHPIPITYLFMGAPFDSRSHHAVQHTQQPFMVFFFESTFHGFRQANEYQKQLWVLLFLDVSSVEPESHHCFIFFILPSHSFVSSRSHNGAETPNVSHSQQKSLPSGCH